MTLDSTDSELLGLIQEAREYVRYLGELGVEAVELDVRAAAEKSTASLASVTELPARRESPADRTPVKRMLPSTETAQPEPTSQSSLFVVPAPPQQSLTRSSETLEDIWRDIGDCTRCGLCEGRTQVVNTHGNPKARLMFIGEAPGADEDAQGKPFVGRAGQLLTKIIEAIGLKREEVLIGNVNRCRPPANRQPTLEEAAICRPFLFREIAAAQPDVIVVMGNTALRNLLEVREGITRVRGQFQDFRGIKVMPTFHPAYLLRDPSKKRETWEDLKKVRDYLDSVPPRRD
ncbi:MAG TPA: uracil-DNA glycosylase [Pyrinomonadaceae bacterium]|nr:uracil-DNA glycosylase [Pyrinomonadaceae bacterium]